MPAGQLWPDAQATLEEVDAHTEPAAHTAYQVTPGGQYCPLTHRVCTAGVEQ